MLFCPAKQACICEGSKMAGAGTLGTARWMETPAGGHGDASAVGKYNRGVGTYPSLILASRPPFMLFAT